MTEVIEVSVPGAQGPAGPNVRMYSPGHLHGLTLSNNVADATNDIDFAAGTARDSTDTSNIVGSAMTKRLDAGWAAGTNQGFRNTAIAIANTTYHIYAIAKANGADPDYYAHTSAVVATVLAALQAETGGGSYLYVRRIGSILRESAAIVVFRQIGDVFHRARIAGRSSASAAASALLAFLVPVGIVVAPIFESNLDVPTSSIAYNAFGDAANGSADVIVQQASAGAGDTNALSRMLINGAFFTNTSAELYFAAVIAAGTISTNAMFINGWIDTRGRVA